jgi:TolA-binding protein
VQHVGIGQPLTSTDAYRKKENMKIFAGILVAVFCLMVSGCAEYAFKAAAKKDTLNAYGQYLSKYPDNEDSDKARKRIAELAFEEAQKEDTASAYEAFLKQYPKSEYSESALYKKAQKEDTIEAYEEFLKQYPEGELSLKADARLGELWFNKAQKEETIDAYEDFIKRYPECELSLTANARLEELWVAKAQKEETIDAYEAFLKKYPQSRFAAEIKNKLADLKIPLLIKTNSKFSKFDIKRVRPEPPLGNAKDNTGRQIPDDERQCKIDLSQSHVQGVIETAALVYGKEVSLGSIQAIGIKSIVIDGEEKYFLICKHGELIRSWERRPKIAYKGISIKSNPSTYRVQHSDQFVILTADRENEMILFPLTLDKVHCEVNVDKDLVPLPAEPKILRPRF